MATYNLDEWSGFFNAMMVNGQYDRVYNAEHFANYFANFISNGVFAQPTDQLKVSSNDGLTVSIKAGKAYIKGYAYTLKYDSTITFDPNMENVGIICKVVVEYIPTDRIAKIRVIENANTAFPDNEYQLVLCSFTLPVGASEITEAMLTDRRPDNTYCGFVTGLVQQIDFTTLMEQEKAQFNEWFEEMKGQLSEDAAGNLQNQINTMTTTFFGAIDDLDTKHDQSVIDERQISDNRYLYKSQYKKNTTSDNGYVPYLDNYVQSWSGCFGSQPGPFWVPDWRATLNPTAYRISSVQSGDKSWTTANGTRCPLGTLNFAFICFFFSVDTNVNTSSLTSYGRSTKLRQKGGEMLISVYDIINTVYSDRPVPSGWSTEGNLKIGRPYVINQDLCDDSGNVGATMHLKFSFGNWLQENLNSDGLNLSLSMIDYKNNHWYEYNGDYKSRIFGIVVEEFSIAYKTGYTPSNIKGHDRMSWGIGGYGTGYKKVGSSNIYQIESPFEEMSWREDIEL